MAKSNSTKPEKWEIEFYASVGQAIAEWSRVEYVLCMWFGELLCQNDGFLRTNLYKVFNSARNYNTKRDLLISAIDAMLIVGKKDAKKKEFLKFAVKRANSYAGFRNRMAHNLHAKNGQTNRMEIREQADLLLEEVPILKFDIDRSTKNFEKLATILAHAVALNGITPSKGLQLLARLPSEANLRRATPKPSKRANRAPKPRKSKQP